MSFLASTYKSFREMRVLQKSPRWLEKEDSRLVDHHSQDSRVIMLVILVFDSRYVKLDFKIGLTRIGQSVLKI